MKRRSFPHRKDRHGMVLLEVITALTIFTVVAFSLVTALDLAFDASKERNEVDASTRGLQNQLVLLRSSRINPVDQDLPDDGSGLTYHLQIVPAQVKDQKGRLLAGLYQVTITCDWKSNAGPEERSVTEMIYQP